jgi:hypothetical protein
VLLHKGRSHSLSPPDLSWHFGRQPCRPENGFGGEVFFLVGNRFSILILVSGVCSVLFWLRGYPITFVLVFIASRWPNRHSGENGALRSNAPGCQSLKSKLSPTLRKDFPLSATCTVLPETGRLAFLDCKAGEDIKPGISFNVKRGIATKPVFFSPSGSQIAY